MLLLVGHLVELLGPVTVQEQEDRPLIVTHESYWEELTVALDSLLRQLELLALVGLVVAVISFPQANY